MSGKRFKRFSFTTTVLYGKIQSKVDVAYFIHMCIIANCSAPKFHFNGNKLYNEIHSWGHYYQKMLYKWEFVQ
jgi:hypothetical protein